MPYPKPTFRRAQVDAAGRVLAETAIADANTVAARRQAREIVDDWRASHGYPLVALRILLQERAQRVDPDALVAQRLKRLASVEAKLRRFPQDEGFADAGPRRLPCRPSIHEGGA